ncbi:MAG TPA: serine/threonine-protein kinase [Kofleriaceae bacterium]|nr:serine/threonine-protein kinase [Kofleriaceae bacterium]
MSDDTKATQATWRATEIAPTQGRVSVREIPRPEGIVRPPTGRYHEHGLLGRGGMGEVSLVEDVVIGREIAVKTIASKYADSQTMRDRFLREVRIQGQLEYPSIVPVYDVGIDASGHDYFTMKRIAGRTLQHVLRAVAAGDAATVQQFPRNGLLALFRQICLAIAYAHSRGVIHRDLKPSNVMIGDFGEVYVLDWGIARLVAETDDSLDTDVVGTPGYMSPEQLDSAHHVDEASDVYALGAILFEVLALVPWHPLRAAEAIASTVESGCARPALRAPERDIPPELDDLCARATAARRDDRIRSARELADAIDRYLEGDRDLARRRELARDHAAAARAARERVANGPAAEADAARREAMREAGRAVALDPEGREGLRAAVELMLEPPSEVPAEVVRELQRAQSDRIRAGLAPAIVAFAFFLLVALVVPMIAGPVSWIGPLLVTASMTGAIAVTVLLLRSKNLAVSRGKHVVLALLVSAAIGFASTYAGAMILVPALAVAVANSFAASQVEWRLYLLLVALGVAVPFFGEWLGVFPQSYEFRPDGMLVKPVAAVLSEIPLRLTSLATTIGVLLASVFYVRRVFVVEQELRRTWLLHNWHLRQMAQVSDAATSGEWS